MIYVCDDDFNILDLIENFTSLIWAERYYTEGDCELHIGASNDLFQLFKKSKYLVRADNFKKCMIIKKIELTTNVEEGDFLTITGVSLSSILAQRIIWTQTRVSGIPSVAITKLINENAIAPSITDRIISNLELGEMVTSGDSFTQQFTGDNLLEAIQGICLENKLGYDVQLDLKNKKFIFILYEGVDRSYNQKVNPRVVFAPDMDNLISTNYSWTSENFKNVALVAGEGEGTARRRVTVGSGEGIDRFEAYVDARDISSNNGEISETEYNSALMKKGCQTMKENYSEIESIEGEIEPNINYELGEDYSLGDVVSVKNEYGLSFNVRITGIIESEDESGFLTIAEYANITSI